MVGIGEIAFGSDGERAPVGGEGGEDAGGFGKQRLWQAEGEAFADAGFGIGKEAGVWRGLGERSAGDRGLLSALN